MAFDEGADEDVKDRGKEKAEDGDAQHAEEDGGAEGLAHFGTGAFC